MRHTFLSFTLLATAPWLAAQGNKVALDLPANDVAIDVIVQFTSPLSDQQDRDVQSKGGALKAKLGRSNAAIYSVKGSSVRDIAALPEVAYVSPDRALRGQLDYTTTAVNANIAWKYGWSGKGIGIAVIDSGISSSLDLLKGGNRVVYSEAFGGFLPQVDTYGHGTHVAGIAAGDGSASGGKLSGVAPGASLIDLRVLDGSGIARDSAVIAAIGRAIDLKDKYKIRIINLSLGRPVYESYRQDPLCQAVEAAWKAGIVVVVAAEDVAEFVNQDA